MKAPLLIFISCFLFYFHSQAFDNENKGGVHFFEGSWAELLEMSKQENKPIFIDVYTDWCPPCRQMDREVLPLPEVGEFFNASFISFKLNAEKGEGIEIARAFDVQAYPTYLFLDKNGYLLHRAVGYFDQQPFIAQAEKALKEADKNVLLSLEKQFKEGYRDGEFLREYINSLTLLGLNNKDVLNAYFELTPIEQLSTDKELFFIAKNIDDANSNALVFLMEKYHMLDVETQKEMTPNLYSSLLELGQEVLREGKPLEFKQALNYLDQLGPNLSEKEVEDMYYIKLLYAVMVKDASLTKQMGYAMVGKVMEIPFDFIKAEDKKRYNQLMEPYWNGKEDSTKIEGFQEEKQFIQAIYSKELSYKLYEPSKAFVAVLEDDDKALEDAVIWIRQLNLLQPDRKLFLELQKRIEEKMHSSSLL